MKDLQRVVWAKGMFLTPQHFQAQAQFVENLLHFRFNRSNYANWGVSRLEIDREALANGQFRLGECAGLMPDGLPFDMPGSEDPPAARGVEEAFSAAKGRLDVYLAAPEERGRSKRVALAPPPDGGPPATRYLAETVAVLDENTGDEDKPVQLARRNDRILFGSESLDGFTRLRLARVVLEGDGSYGLEPEHVAPCLDVATSDALMRLLRRQVEILSSKMADLRAARRQGARGLATFAPTDLADYLLLSVLSTYVPALRHFWKVRRGHPEPLFALMVQLAGALSVFSLEQDPLDFPEYDHDELGFVFGRLDAALRSTLQIARREDCITIPLVQVDRHIWTGSVPDDQYFDGTRFYLSISSSISVDELIQKTPRLVKLAAPDAIQRIVDHALPGIGLRHEPAPPSAIRIQLDNQYFALDQTARQWEAITAARAVSVFVPGQISTPRMELLIVLSR